MLPKGKRKKQAIGTISKGAQISKTINFHLQILDLAEKDYKTTAINIFKVVEKIFHELKEIMMIMTLKRISS